MGATDDRWLERVAAALGTSGAVRHLGGQAFLLHGPGSGFVAKRGAGCADEAAGLGRLAQVEGGPPVPEVVLAQGDVIVTRAIAQVARRNGHEEDLGRSLARLHSVDSRTWGGGSSWVGACPVDPRTQTGGAEFYGLRLRGLAARCGLERIIEPVTARLDELLPPEGPVLLHGDLWWGNVLFGADNRAWVIDPSVHGGHGEADLAMLALFGSVPKRVYEAYDDVRPRAAGWEDRVGLFQLVPLLVHTVLFGDSYRARTESVARRYR